MKGKKLGRSQKESSNQAKAQARLERFSCPHINPTFVVGTCCSDCNDSCMVFDCR